MDETTLVLQSLLDAHERREPCALVTVVETSGSIPRAVGAKMLVFPDFRIVGTVGGGKFESLVIDESIAAIVAREPVLKSYPLHEGDAQSFGAICGGEVRVLIEPHRSRESLTLIGAGHCSRAIGALALKCGMRVTVVDDRPGPLKDFPANQCVSDCTPAEFIERHDWQKDEAVVLVSRNYMVDRDALRAAMSHPGAGYVGMIGSRKKVRKVFAELEAEGVPSEDLAKVFAPIGLAVGADSPTEIAISVLAEILAVLRSESGRHLHEEI